MLRVLLAKDLRRAWRNPLPWLINLIVPLAITTLIGLVFGGHDNNAPLGAIRFAVVDEDHSMVSHFLRGMANQELGGVSLEPVAMERAEALKLVNAGKISAVLVIETNFMRNYLTDNARARLQLIKNPAESIHPAALEEMLGALVSGLNVISRNFHSDFPEWRNVSFDHADPDLMPLLMEETRGKMKSASRIINPPLASYQLGASAEGTVVAKSPSQRKGAKAEGSSLTAVFGYMLVGMSAMFLLFLGQNAMTDLHRELRYGTFERYQTLRQNIWPFILGKMLFTVVILLICGAVMLGGGGLAFQIHWRNPLALAALVAAYSVFIAALFATLVALAPDERRAGAYNHIAALFMGLAGGCAFPPQNFPEFLRKYITPHVPSYWFASTARDIQLDGGNGAWGLALLKLLAGGAILAVLAAWLFRRKFKFGLRV